MTAWSIAHGDVVEVLRGFEDCSFDALCCDPPYGFKFMNKAWDYDVPSVDVWRECLRVLKPGAPFLAFGGSRTFHRIATGIEDAGAELFDCLMWLYAKGMPKPATTTDKYIDKHLKVERPTIGTRVLTGNAAVDTKTKGGTYGIQVGTVPPKEIAVTGPGSPEAKLWEGYGHALKPSYEPIIAAVKPFDGTIANNVLSYGVGALNIRACRMGETGGTRKVGNVSDSVHVYGDGLNGGTKEELQIGKWPSNVGFDEDSATLLDEEVGPRPSSPYRANTAVGNVLPMTFRSPGGRKENGGPSRFFFSAKVSRKERDAGCEALPFRTAAQATGRKEGSAGSNRPQAGAGRGSGCHNHHPTLKPIALTTWLATLVRPPVPGVILVPFAGAGSEMIGALKAGWPCVFGIEREAEYVEIARARLAHWCPESEAA